MNTIKPHTEITYVDKSTIDKPHHSTSHEQRRKCWAAVLSEQKHRISASLQTSPKYTELYAIASIMIKEASPQPKLPTIKLNKISDHQSSLLVV